MTTSPATAAPATDTKTFRRATLIVNPYSSGMTAKRERTIVRVLGEHLDVTVRRTERGGHATELATSALDEGADLIVACGGDGTGNEVVNGMRLGQETAGERPAFALVPAGGTNVFCRGLGLPNHPIRAVEQIAQAVAAGRMRTVNLGRVDERIFLFAAGVGLDAAVVRQIELRRRGRRPSDLAHASAAFGIVAHEKFVLRERMTIAISDAEGRQQETLRSALVLCCNSTPLTYMGRMALTFLPDASLDGGLDIIAPPKLTPGLIFRLIAEALGSGGKKRLLVKPAKAQRRADLPSFHVHCDDPQPCQVDGEYIGERTDMTFTTLRSAVRFVV